MLAAVQGRKRVAWMQLSNATVESFADGVLTLAFAQAGIAKGFLTGGYDKDLGQVLTDMFGLTPAIRTSVGGPGGTGPDSDSGAGSPYPPPPSQARRSAAPGPGEAEQRTDNASRAGAEERPADKGRRDSGRSARPRPSQPESAPADPYQANAADSEPAPGDLPAPDVLTGTDLIERELGGRVIRELDGP